MTRYHIVRRAEADTSGTLVAPSWVSSMTIGTWYAIGGTSLDLGLSSTNFANSVDPDLSGTAPYKGSTGFRSIMDKWNSGIYAPTLGASGSLLFFGGGHRDFYGNMVLRFDLSTRTWILFKSPSTAGPFTSGAALPNGLYVDLTPSPPHTYNFLFYHAARNALVCAKSISNINAPDTGASGVARAHILDLTSSTWTISPSVAGGTLQSPSQGSGCYDSVRQAIWTLQFSVGRFGRLTNLGTDNGDGTFGTWAVFNPAGTYGFDQSIGHDPILDWILVVDSNLGNVWRKDPSNMDGARTAVTLSGTPTLDTQSALNYCQALGGFVYHRNASGAVHLLSTANGYANAAFTSLTVNTNGKSFAVDTGGGGFFNKSQTVQYPDGKVIQVLAARTDVPVLSMRLQ